MSRSAAIYLTVILIREEMDHPWQDHRWRLAGLLPVGAEKSGTKAEADSARTTWRELASGPGWLQYEAGTLPLELFRKETSAYKANLENKVPVIYAVLREAESEEDDQPIHVHLITASPFEAQDYLDSSEELVESLPMPEYLRDWIAGFIEEHHEEEKFVKRQRDEIQLDKHIFGQEPIFAKRKRVNGNGGGSET